MKTINKFTSAVDAACRTAAALLLVFICAAIAGQVAVRKLGGTLVWVDELTRYAFVYLVLFGTVDLARTGGHIAITSFLDMLPGAVRKGIEILIYLAVSAFSGIMTFAYVNAVTKYEGAPFSVVKSISMSQHYILVSILTGLITIASILHIVDIILSFQKPAGGEK